MDDLQLEHEEFYSNQTVPPEQIVPVDDKHQINKTRPESCDQEISFFTLQYDRLNFVANTARGG